MKKGHLIFLLFMIAFMVFAFSGRAPITTYHTAKTVPDPAALSRTAEQEKEEQPSVTLPVSLQVIGEEAFEGTALQNVVLPESVREIGDRAFADNEDLLAVQLPGELQSVGDDILAESENAVLAVYANSSAQDLAVAKGYRVFKLTAVSENKTDGPFVLMTGTVFRTKEYKQESDTCSAETKSRRTGRTGAELKGELYRGVAALYVQSRYFP